MHIGVLMRRTGGASLRSGGWDRGTRGNILAVEGEHDQLLELVMAPDTQRLIALGDQILEDFCWEVYHVGEGAEAFVSTWFEVAGELGNL